jgi:CRISPR-associated endonuclease Cas2
MKEMPLMTIKHYIISYDICDKKRLAKVARLLKSQSFKLQGSVYYWIGKEEDLEILKNALEKMINRYDDDIRGYLITRDQVIRLFGAPFMLDECYLTHALRYQHYPDSMRKQWHKVMGRSK